MKEEENVAVQDPPTAASSNGTLSGAPAAPAVEEIALAEIELDAGTRIRSLDEDAITRYAADMAEFGGFGLFPPLEVWDIHGYKKPVLVKGFHRHGGSERTFGPDYRVPVIRKAGKLNDAILEAMRDNRTFGLRLSPKDRVGILRRVFDKWGPKRADKWIAQQVGEKDRDLVARVRTEWLREHGQQDPETRTVERGGTEYEQKVPRKSKKGSDDDRGPDTSESAPMDLEDRGGHREQDPERAARIDREFLDVIPCRQHIHESILPVFDAMALDFRDLDPILVSLRRWCSAHEPQEGGVPNPVFVQVERFAYMPVPVPVQDQRGWINCAKCQDSDSKSTGSKEGVICGGCNGTGAKIPGFSKL